MAGAVCAWDYSDQPHWSRVQQAVSGRHPAVCTQVLGPFVCIAANALYSTAVQKPISYCKSLPDQNVMNVTYTSIKIVR